MSLRDVYLNDRQLNLVLGWRENGHQIEQSVDGDSVYFYAVKGNKSVLLFVVNKDEAVQNYKNKLGGSNDESSK